MVEGDKARLLFQVLDVTPLSAFSQAIPICMSRLLGSVTASGGKDQSLSGTGQYWPALHLFRSTVPTDRLAPACVKCDE